ncbi:PREDICTED: protein S100-A9-like [Acanthisitta chloris]|uniref:protein S100-A9-like n=1 Tax=Acanthisitta chloris TaxID=57068 RepID=UPI0004F0ED2B|nr:PREDICTED: protein S100-A9-like [Acanthisitta chloris]
MKTKMELAMESIINTYHQYSARDPLDDYLSKPEFSQLMKETAEHFLHNTIPPNMTIDDYINKLFTKADANHDGRLKFTEFLTTLSLVAIDAHNKSHEGPGGDHGHDHDHGGRGHGHSHGRQPRN